MTKTIGYWKHEGKEGYTVADITYHAELYYDQNEVLQEEHGKHRRGLQSAIRDAKKMFKKNPDALISIYAVAEITSYCNDGTPLKRPFGYNSEDWARIGTIDSNGEYFDFCEPVKWL